MIFINKISKAPKSDNFDFRGFYNSVGAKYPEEDIVYKTPSGKVRRKFVIELIKKYQKPPFLDIGCGAGEYLRHAISPKYGIDLSHPSLIRCANNVHTAMLVEASAENVYIYDDNIFNTVLCSEVIEHIEHPELLLNGVYKILAKGGVFIITCPNYRGEKPVMAEVGIMKDYGVEGEEYLHTAYRPEELSTMAKDAGFKVMESFTFEKEMRYWLKLTNIPVKIVSWIFGKKFTHKFTRINQNFCYFFIKYSGISILLRTFVNEGIRTCIILSKD